jgi:hypothetical protein
MCLNDPVLGRVFEPPVSFVFRIVDFMDDIKFAGSGVTFA